MRSVADDLRSEMRDEAARRTPAERLDLALQLGDDDVALLCAARGLPLEEGRRLIARSRSVGRMPSVAAGEPAP